MKYSIWKRMGCAALAAELLLTPLARAIPLVDTVPSESEQTIQEYLNETTGSEKPLDLHLSDATDKVEETVEQTQESGTVTTETDTVHETGETPETGEEQPSENAAAESETGGGAGETTIPTTSGTATVPTAPTVQTENVTTPATTSAPESPGTQTTTTDMTSESASPAGEMPVESAPEQTSGTGTEGEDPAASDGGETGVVTPPTEEESPSTETVSDGADQGDLDDETALSVGEIDLSAEETGDPAIRETSDILLDEVSPENSDLLESEPSSTRSVSVKLSTALKAAGGGNILLGATPAPAVPDVIAIYAVYGFGREYGYRIPDSNDTFNGADGAYVYNFEGDSFFTCRSTSADATNVFTNHAGIALLAQRYRYLNTSENTWNSGADSNFRWDSSSGKLYFNSTLPTKSDFPRLPDLEFSGEWYVADVDVVREYLKNFDTDAADYEFSEIVGSGDLLIQNISHAVKVNNEPIAPEKFDASKALDSETYDGLWDNDSVHVSDGMVLDDDFPTHNIMLIGKWNPSTNSTATDLKLFYPGAGASGVMLYAVGNESKAKDLAKLTAADLEDPTKNPVAKSTSGKDLLGSATSFFVRVPAGVEGLTFSLESFEPGSSLTIDTKYAGTAVADGVYSSIRNDFTLVPVGKRTGPNDPPTNSESSPARGSWTFKDASAYIPLKQVGEAETQKYNVVTFTVTAPDGTSTTKYTVYVQRLAIPEMTLDPGNTPMGMIQREPTDSGWSEDYRTRATNSFKTGTRSFVVGGVNLAPTSTTVNNGGYVWNNSYLEAAWGRSGKPYGDVDLDAEAIVVYQNQSFLTPGFQITDGLRNTHTGASETISNDSSISWELTLQTVATLGPDAAKDTLTGTPRTWSGTDTDVSTISLVGENIKPGVYKLNYRYTDAYDLVTYSGDAYRRTVVVLPLRGDVDMDGAVTVADGIRLRKLLADGYFNDVIAGTCGDVAKCLYYYRVCDVTGTPNLTSVDSDDVTALLTGYYPKLIQGFDFFYIPLGSGPPDSGPPTVSTVAPSISLKYLGAGKTPSGLDPGKGVEYDPEPTAESNVVFWMEAQIAGVDNLSYLTENLISLTVTLTYDSTYVTPYDGTLNDTGQWLTYLRDQNTQWAGWTVQSSGIGITPVDHYSKAPPGLDQMTDSAYRELRFSVTGTDQTLAALEAYSGSGGILRVPFRLIKMPSGKAERSAKLVSLTLGMRDLTITADGASGLELAAWSSSSLAGPTSVTKDLSDLLHYGGSDAVVLGKDLTPCAVIYLEGTAEGDKRNPTYGEAFTSETFGVMTLKNGSTEVKRFSEIPHTLTESDFTGLPEGVAYVPGAMSLQGTPKETGTFDFKVYDVPYRLIVEKATLTITPKAVEKYYGEPNNSTTKQTFTYDKTQIKQRDVDKNLTNDGTAEALAALLQESGTDYRPPDITLMETTGDGGIAADEQTVPGSYYVSISGGSSANYELVFTRIDSTGNLIKTGDKVDTFEDYGTAKLTVKPRPIRIGQVIRRVENTSDYITEILETADPNVDRSEKARYTNEKRDFTFADVTVDGQGLYNGIPLTNTAAHAVVGADQLEIKVTFRVDVDTSKGDSTIKFILSANEEDRGAMVSGVELTEDVLQNRRYVLEQGTAATPDSTAKVSKRIMTQVVIRTKPTLNYTYGQTLSMTGLLVSTYYADNPTDPNDRTTIKQCTDYDLIVQWVDKDGQIPENSTARVATDNQQLNVTAHNGKFLCFTGLNGKRAWLGPFVVEKKTMTLTVHPKARYYGETIADNEWVVTYDRDQMATWDKDGTTSYPNTGHLADLTGLPGYEAPTYYLRETPSLSGTEVTAGTDVGTYYVLISGKAEKGYKLETDDYKFNFARNDVTTEPSPGTTLPTDSEFGYARLTIERRPILIEAITDLAGSLYHDSTTNVIENLKAQYSTSRIDFRTALPDPYVPGDSTTIYYTKGSDDPYLVSMELTDTAVYSEDALTATYTATYETAPDGVSGAYFDMQGYLSIRVTAAVTDLILTQEGSGKNYILVYPAAVDPDYTEAGNDYKAIMNAGWAGYTKAGSTTQGLVTQRQIIHVAVVSGPTKKLNRYVYGDVLDLTGIKVQVTYGDEQRTRSLITLSYGQSGGVTTSTFQNVGLDVKWKFDTQVGDSAVQGEQLSVGRHSGAKLTVTAPTYPGVAPLEDVEVGTVTVAKKLLTLVVDDSNQNRVYGENNNTYRFTFAEKDDTTDPADPRYGLVWWDKRLLLGESYADKSKEEIDGVSLPAGTCVGSATELDTPAVSAALEAVNAPYVLGKDSNKFVGPVFSTTAAQTSDVGTYDLTLSGASMANYDFEYKKGTITVTKRPITVEQVLKAPLYVISQDALSASGDTVVDTTCYAGSLVEGDSAELSLSAGTGYGLTSALVAGDGIAVSMKVKYNLNKSSNVIPEGSYENNNVTVAVSELKLVEGSGSSGNYELTKTTATTATATASVHKREIQSIAIKSLPANMDKYVYGDTMDLSGMMIVVTYAPAGNNPAYSIEVGPGALSGLYVNYVSAQEMATIQGWSDEEFSAKLANQILIHPTDVNGNDHLTIATDYTGFAHNGKYLMVSARSAADHDFVRPVFSKKAIKVSPRELEFTLTANSKSYDRTTRATGTITLKTIGESAKHGVYGSDLVWVENGQTYTDPASYGYSFPSSSSYGTGITFTFTDPNVKWQVAGRDNYVNVQEIPLEVTNITLAGADKANYTIAQTVTTSNASTGWRPALPTARIYSISRPAPETEINLMVDEHTNAVWVEPVEDVSAFYVENDQKNSELHYEYSVLYLDENGVLQQTAYQDSPFFGGELVTYDSTGTPMGTGQSAHAGDTSFATRGVENSLGRGNYVGAVVRLSPTNNYSVSDGTASTSIVTETTTTDPETGEDVVEVTKTPITVVNGSSVSTNTTLRTAFDDAVTRAKAAAGRYPRDPGGTARLIERDPGPVIKTYTYRIDVISSVEEKDGGNGTFLTALEEVWFTDIAKLRDSKEADRLVGNNTTPPLFYGYYWDPGMKVSVEFGDKFNLATNMQFELPVEGGSTESKAMTQVNADDNIRLYVSLVRKGGGSGIIGPEKVEIVPESLLAYVGDEPIQLELILTPQYVVGTWSTWSSSDESVVTVSKGLVTIVGPGEAEITITMFNGVKCTIPVRVLPAREDLSPFIDTMFDVLDEEPYMDVDEQGLFRPEDTMTRRELILIMEHFFRTIEGGAPRIAEGYLDVPEGAPYAEQVATLEAWGIVEGVGHNLFAPEWTATRAEAATILCRMLMLPVNNDPEGPHAFRDAGPEDTWAWGYIDALATAGITNGTGGGCFSPDCPITRAELATFIARILATRANKNVDTLVVPADVHEGYWAYEPILRAVNSGAVMMAVEPKKEGPGAE